MKNIFKEESAEDVIKILKEIPKLEPLGKNLPTLYNEAKQKNDIKTLKLIREVYWAWSNNNPRQGQAPVSCRIRCPWPWP